jgi:hypothetical protein
VNASIAFVIQLNFGRYAGSINAKTVKTPNNISTSILKVKPFPVINGKNILLLIINGIKGIKKRPPNTVYFNISLVVVINESITNPKLVS